MSIVANVILRHDNAFVINRRWMVLPCIPVPFVLKKWWWGNQTRVPYGRRVHEETIYDQVECATPTPTPTTTTTRGRGWCRLSFSSCGYSTQEGASCLRIPRDRTQRHSLICECPPRSIECNIEHLGGMDSQGNLPIVM